MLVVLFTDVVVVVAGGVVLCGLPFDRLLLCTLTNFRTTTRLLAALDEDEEDEDDDDRVLAAQTGAIVVVVVVGILSALGCRVTNVLDGGLSSDRSEDGMISLPMSPSNAVAALLGSVNDL